MKKKKQGEVQEITAQDSQEFKETIIAKSEDTFVDAPVVSKGTSSILTMRNSRPYRVFFDEKGKEVSAEDMG